MQQNHEAHPEQYENYLEEWEYALRGEIELRVANTTTKYIMQDLHIDVQAAMQADLKEGVLITLYAVVKYENLKLDVAATYATVDAVTACTLICSTLRVGNQPYEPETQSFHATSEPSNADIMFIAQLATVIIDALSSE